MEWVFIVTRELDKKLERKWPEFWAMEDTGFSGYVGEVLMTSVYITRGLTFDSQVFAVYEQESHSGAENDM